MDLAIQKPGGLFFNLAKLVEENQKINEEILTNQFHLSIPMAKRALQRCVDYKIIEKEYDNSSDYILTKDIGQILLNEGMLFFKENGKYRLILTDDPLIPQRVISVQRIGRQTESAMPITQTVDLKVDELLFQNLIIGTDNDEEKFINSPTIRIEKCYKELIEERDDKSNLNIICTLTSLNTDIKISGSFSNRKVQATLTAIPSNFNYQTVFEAFLKQLNIFQDWDPKKSALEISFDLKNKKCNYIDFLLNIPIESPSIPEFGNFNKLNFLIPIAPKSDEDCLDWEKFLLFKAITQIVQPHEYADLTENIQNQMEEKNGKSFSLPSQEEYAQEILNQTEISTSEDESEFDRRPKIYWYLQCPLDLINENESIE